MSIDLSLRWQVIEGLSLDVMRGLPDGCVDAVVTDPPYGIDGGKGGDSRLYAKGAYEKTGWRDDAAYISEVVIPIIAECFRVSRGPVVVTPGVRCLHAYPPATDVGCFWTPASSTHGPWGFTTFQPILYYGKDWRAGKGPLPSGRLLTERAEPNGHPCPKPVGAWGWLIDKACPEGSLVLDPFAGSGTGGVACLNSERRFIGIEREPAYCAIARQRIADAAAQGNLFDEVRA